MSSALFLEICDAVNYAHQRGVIHRDLKPSNIMVKEDAIADGADSTGAAGGSVKVLDFGLARITDGDVAATTAMTETGQVQGTLSYMSPHGHRGLMEGGDGVAEDLAAFGQTVDVARAPLRPVAAEMIAS